MIDIKELNTMNPFVLAYIVKDQTEDEIEVVNEIVKIFQTKKCIAGVELQRILDEKNLSRPRALSVLGWFETLGWVTTEVRKEEFITIQTKSVIWRDRHGNIIPAEVKATLDNGEVVLIDNPKCARRYGATRTYGRVDKQIQVCRKYYTWVA